MLDGERSWGTLLEWLGYALKHIVSQKSDFVKWGDSRGWQRTPLLGGRGLGRLVGKGLSEERQLLIGVHLSDVVDEIIW